MTQISVGMLSIYVLKSGTHFVHEPCPISLAGLNMSVIHSQVRTFRAVYMTWASSAAGSAAPDEEAASAPPAEMSSMPTPTSDSDQDEHPQMNVKRRGPR